MTPTTPSSTSRSSNSSSGPTSHRTLAPQPLDHTAVRELLIVGVDKEVHVYDLATMQKCGHYHLTFVVLDLACVNIPHPVARTLCVCAGEANTLTVLNIGEQTVSLQIPIGVPSRLPKYGNVLVKNISVVRTPRGLTPDLRHEMVTYVLAGCAKDPSGTSVFCSAGVYVYVTVANAVVCCYFFQQDFVT